MLVRTVECLEGNVEVELVCEPVVRLRARRRPTWTLRGRRPPRRRRDRRRARGSACTPTSRSASRRTGSGRGTSSARASARSARSPGPRSWPRRRPSDEAVERIDATTRFWRAWLGRARIPDHRFRDPIQRSALDDQGAHLHADRRDGRRAHDLAARDARAASATGTTATPGSATRPSRSRRCTC